MQNKSIMNPGNMFILAYCLYFLITPLAFYLETEFGIDLNIEGVVYHLYNQKGLRFLTLNSLYFIVSGLAFFVIGYYFVIKNIKNINIRFLHNGWPYKNILIGSALLFLAGTASKIIGVIKGAHLHFHFSSSLLGSNLVAYFTALNILHIASLALLIFGYFLSKDNDDKAWSSKFATISIVAFILMFLISLNFGGKILTLTLIFPLIVIASYFTKNIKKQARLLVILIVASFVIVIVKNISNNYMYEPNVTDMTIANDPATNKYKDIMLSIVGRINMTHIFTEITARNESEVETSTNSYTDRFLKKIGGNKIKGKGNEFARQYGFVVSTDHRTGVGKTIIGGFYLYHGAYGVLLGMFLLGMLYRLINKLTVTNVGLFFYSIILTRLMARIEQDVFFLLSTIGMYLIIALLMHITIMENGIIDKVVSLRDRAAALKQDS
jgi:hypothetical protein